VIGRQMSDLRYAFRQVQRRPGLSVAVILMLALGIGATTAIFSLYDQILVRPLPVPPNPIASSI
jgi:putative ABC transport system permease protein